MWEKDSLEKLGDAVSTYDKEGVDRHCGELIRWVEASEEPFPEKQAKQVLTLLRRKRFFVAMRKVADAFLQAGQTSGQIRRQYAQALIESGDFSAAIGVLEKLIHDCPDNLAEVAEARGLIGRALKQRYVNNPGKTAAQRRVLNGAVSNYYEVYDSQPTQYLWHGINAVACARRAERDGVVVETKFDADAVARNILTAISRQTPDNLYAWDMATAAEANVALGRKSEALDWLKQYVAAAGADAFEVGSTLRQLREVWGFSDSGEGGDLTAVLQAALLMREGGVVSLRGREVKATAERADGRREAFEKVFGPEGPVAYKWYVEGAVRARAVGRVEDRFGRGIGTGFLVRGSDFFPWARPGEILFVTNAHVMGNTELGAVPPGEAEVRFEAADPKRSFTVAALLWESPMNALDATIVRLADLPADVAPIPLASAVEPEFIEGGDRRFYVIGHPHAGALAISLHDNTQVGWRRPFLHYRTPTEPGSSGSPVLNHAWELVALHHAGSKRMQRLDGHPGYYEANEGIWIHEIIHRTREAPPAAEAAPAPAPPQSEPPAPATRKGVFISYSHKDKKFLGELQRFLKPTLRGGEIQKWDDTDLRPGEDWLGHIRSAMATAKVAILLVSQDYLESDFIHKEELPQLLEAAIRDGLTMFWIALGHSTVHTTPLYRLQAANDPARPLKPLGKTEREQEWLEIVKKIEVTLK
jgi:tetratricopeptide (TPR) repeat protein